MGLTSEYYALGVVGYSLVLRLARQHVRPAAVPVHLGLVLIERGFVVVRRARCFESAAPPLLAGVLLFGPLFGLMLGHLVAELSALFGKRFGFLAGAVVSFVDAGLCLNLFYIEFEIDLFGLSAAIARSHSARNRMVALTYVGHSLLTSPVSCTYSTNTPRNS